ncbi:glycosyl hydrolases family 18 domain-containing protein [Sarocladium implicatum]|nr:glycosyl hydrolases family 18 domain-containing protein [Sarocladium implicatum]
MSVGALNGYWGQHGVPGFERLANYCDSGIEYVTLSFVNLSPENDPSGYPGTNFAAHCWDEYYANPEGVESHLLSHCPTIQEDIPYCQERGVKVLLSIGGHYNDGSNNYAVSSEENGVEFAEFLYKAFGPLQDGYTGPRPFDTEETKPAIDGFDFDIEARLDNRGYIAMVETFRELDSSLFISAAPQCPTDERYFYLADLIEEAEFDALFIQFYNNPQCELYSDSGINYFDWVNVIKNSSKSQNAKLFFGLPASPSAVDSSTGSGYVQPDDLHTLVCAARDLPSWGGVSLWDLSRGAENVVGANRNYIDVAQDALLGIGCPAVTSSVTTTDAATSTPATSVPAADPTTTAATTSPGLPSNGTITTRPPPVTTTLEESMTTSTVVSTATHTIPCPDTKKCHGGVYVTTEIIPLYTTICPVGWKPTITENPHMPKPTSGFGGGKPSGDKPHGDKPHGDKPEGNKPDGDKPEGDKPSGDKPEGEVPSGDKPSGDKPSGDEPSGDEPSGDKPSGDKPSGDKPEGDLPGGGEDYDKTTTIVVPPPTGAVTPKPEGPTETPATAGASSLAAGVSGLLAVAALQVFFL